ncbi:MAG: methyltransferase domain-containing protein [Phycisphaerae bacterium]|nr:methyltransferase domain-containing protein [Phycisphaerae bacterium]MDP7637574.1 methyltransferase domain-containing protein [Phycisphaerae bacterium]
MRWLHRGVVFVNAAAPLPFADETFDYVFSEHMIEHLDYDAGRAFLRECFRVLKPGGRIRIATPSLETLVEFFAPDKTDALRRYMQWLLSWRFPGAAKHRESMVINCALSQWGHRFVYDRVTLTDVLEEAGFADILTCEASQSDHEALRGVKGRGRALDSEEMAAFETMVLEAAHPPMG